MEKSYGLNMSFYPFGLLLLSLILLGFSTGCQYNLETRFLDDPRPGWWDDNWSNRRALTFDNSGQSEDLMDFPVLIKLDNTRIDYNKTQNAGEDLRFVDPNGSSLSYEIEQWNESGESFVWVNVPQIDSSSLTDFIWMYYGNTLSSDSQNPAGVWNANYSGIWHLNETTGSSPINDSTVNSNNGTPQGSLTRISGGAVGGAQDFDAGSDRVRFDINTGATVTISAWAKLDVQGDMLWCIDETGGAATGGPDLFFTGNNIYLNTWDGSSNPFSSQPANVSQWHHYATVISPANTELYIDGVSAGTATYKDPTETVIFIGSSDTGYTWNGSVDEFRISNSERSADWNKAQYDSMTDLFITFGIEE